MEFRKEIANSNMIDQILYKYKTITVDLTYIYSDPLIDYSCSGQTVAFQELFIPIVCLARELLAGLNSETHKTIQIPSTSGTAIPSLEYSLLKLLSYIAGKVLEIEFLLFKSRHQSALDRLLSVNSSRELYEAFIKKMYDGGFSSLLLKYPVMAELFSIVTMQWIETSFELITRLDMDVIDICNTFNNGAAVGEVEKIECGLSDRHNGGRTVAILTFSSGLKLVYKPRSLGMEVSWFNLISKLNDDLLTETFRHIKILSRETYGWMEYVEHLPCSDQEAVRLYYRRAGALLCVVHCLRGTDCHHQNLIANGSYPVLIDLETLFHPYTKELGINENSIESTSADPDIYYSVLRTGLLPLKQFKSGQKSLDMSGFGAGSINGSYPKRLTWVETNTDNMRQEYVEQKITPLNQPYTGNRIHSAQDYVNEIVDGFRKTYSLLLEKKEEYIGLHGPFQCFAAKRSRVVLRSTQQYSLLLQKILEPMQLKNKEKRDSFLKTLHKDLTSSNYSSLLETIIREEEKSLRQLDIPYFSILTSSVSFEGNTKVMENNILLASGMYQAKPLISNISVADLSSQIYYIMKSLT